MLPLRVSGVANTGTKEAMTVCKPNDTAEVVLGRAAQYDLSLCRLRAEPGGEVFEWRWHGRELGPRFGSRALALDWIAQWLDEDTASQKTHVRA
jgi:hypothetical protein